MEKKMENLKCIGVVQGRREENMEFPVVYWGYVGDDGKEHANYLY